MCSLFWNSTFTGGNIQKNSEFFQIRDGRRAEQQRHFWVLLLPEHSQTQILAGRMGAFYPGFFHTKSVGSNRQLSVQRDVHTHTHTLCVSTRIHTHSRNSIKNIPWKSYRSIFLSQKNSSVLRKVYSDEKTLGVVYHFDTLSTKHSSHFVAIQHLYLNRYNQGINYWFSI